MPEPTNRQEFKEYCLRRLGYPVIQINVDPDQVDDRVDEALLYFADYHMDGTEAIYYSYIPTANDFVNKYITLPDNINGVVEIFSVGDPSIKADDLFNIRYQIALNDLYTLTSVSMIPYYMVMEHLALVAEFLVGKQPIRYTKTTNICWLDMDWNAIAPGTFILLKCYQIIDPDVYPKVWRDRWLKEFATALIGEQWGKNLTKFEGMELPGGVKFNGDKILKMYSDEVKELKRRVIEDYSLPVLDMLN